jgi:hypothetical protein
MMKIRSALLLSALASVLTVSNLHAQAIVGAWTYGNTASPTSSGTGTFVFLANGVYFHAESENTADAANGQNGMERGTYTWNTSTSDLTLNSVSVNTNGGWGLSDLGIGNTVNLAVSGDTLTVDGGPMIMSRVTGGSALVGGWTYGNTLSPTANGTGAFVFLSNGVYFHMESENTADAANGQNGMERGTYTWAANTFTLVSTTVNTNGGWGLYENVGDLGSTMNIVVTGDTFAVNGGAADFSRVTAIPEPSTYAAFAGLGALSLAAWRRRRSAAKTVSIQSEL